MIKPRVLSTCHRCQMYQRAPSLVCGIYPMGFPGETCPDYAPKLLTEAHLSWNRVNSRSQFTENTDDLDASQ